MLIFYLLCYNLRGMAVGLIGLYLP
jgi:hypothetical protein